MNNYETKRNYKANRKFELEILEQVKTLNHIQHIEYFPLACFLSN